MEYKIENVEIREIYRSDKKKDGSDYVSGNGNKFFKVDIHIDPREVDDPDFTGKVTYFDYFDNTVNWGKGQTISGEVVRVDKDGRTYFNYQMPPSGKKALELDIKQLEDRIKKLEDKVFGLQGHTEEVGGALEFSKEVLGDSEEETIEDDDLPF
jgi:hypothetical protein